MDKGTKLGLHMLALIALLLVVRLMFVVGAAFTITGITAFLLNHLQGLQRLVIACILVWLGAISYVGYQQLNFTFGRMLDGLVEEAEEIEENEK